MCNWSAGVTSKRTLNGQWPWMLCTGLNNSMNAVHRSKQFHECRAQVYTNPWVWYTGLYKSMSAVQGSIQIHECRAQVYTYPRVPCTGLYKSMSAMHRSIQIHECCAQDYAGLYKFTSVVHRSIQIHEWKILKRGNKGTHPKIKLTRCPWATLLIWENSSNQYTDMDIS